MSSRTDRATGAERERWRRVDALLDAALDLPPAERAAFVACCSHDPTLRDEVAGMLSACESSSDFLAQPCEGASALLALSMVEVELPKPGARVGAYRIVEETGRGGMGVVFLAERDDGAFRKRVALKVIRRRDDGNRLTRRFQEERQILASLEHAGIARLLDGGSLPDGRPYLVMEYVEGTPIDRFCHARRMDIRARLTLFCAVCDAVEYAHRLHVTHRDLKPSNILVTGDAAVKLVDFGVAALQDAGDAEGPRSETEGSAARILTPRYASPEQLRGGPIAATSDVYSLGIILRELIAAAPPDGSGAAVDPGIDAILRRSVEQDPHRRYGSAGALATAVRRCLEERTQPRGWPVRAAALVQRNRTSSIATGAVLVALAGGTGTFLRDRWSGADAPSTRAMPALIAFAEGERLVDEYRMRAAAAAFARAITADSTYWLAYWRHAWALQFHGLTVDSAIVSGYRAHRDELPPADRMLMHARETSDVNERIARLESLVARHPDSWRAWFELGETRMRYAPFAGHTLAQAAQMMRRTVSLNPAFVPGWDRLLWLAIAERDTAASARALLQLRRLRYDSTSVLDGRFDMLLLYRHLHQLAGSGGVPNPSLVDSLAREFRQAGYHPNATGLPDRIQSGLARFDFPRARADLAARQIELGSPAPFHWYVIAISRATRGAWDSALVAADLARRTGVTPMVALHAYRLVAAGVWLGALDPSTAVAWRDRAMADRDRMRPSGQAELAWVDGFFASARRDVPALSRARDALRATGAPETALLDSSLGAFGRELNGDVRGALAMLLALERDRYRVSNEHPFLAGVHRMTAARWLSDMGDTTTALRLLTWHEAIGDPAPHATHATALLAPFAYLQRARLFAGRGEHEKAHAQLARFLDIYDTPVAAHRSLVTEARSINARRR